MKLIPINGVVQELPYNDNLDFLQGLVHGLIEVVSLRNGGLLIVNEEGHCKGLPENRVASKVAEGSVEPDEPIVGVAILLERREAKMFEGA